MENVLSGAAMGAALTAAGVYQPAVILAQFNFSDFSMLQTFLTAAAGSTLLVTLSQTLRLTSLPPRPPSSVLGLFRLDGNLVGGALLGTGMAVSGACPGTVLAQLGVSAGAGGGGTIRSGKYALAGGVLAGWAWSSVLGGRKGGGRARETGEVLVEGQGQEEGREKEKKEKKKGKAAETVYEALGFSRGAVFIGFEVVCAAALVALARYAPSPGGGEKWPVSPVVGGLCMAAAQLVSLVLRRSLLGASTSFEELGGGIGRLLKGEKFGSYGNVLFSAGVVGGAWLLSTMVPALGPTREAAISPLRAALGGFMIILGSRMAGGCTSGHGISGLSLMSLSSFLTVAATFGAGGLVGMVMG
ncbi:hypothetical protein VTK26DRAFT_9229 [Humicola hyalothermophila]